MLRLIAALLVTLCVLPGIARSQTITAADGSFSYRIPAGWTTMTNPASPNKIARTTTYKSFTPNMTVSKYSFGGTLDEYAKGNMAQLQKSNPGFKLLGSSRLKTNAGVPVMKYIVQLSYPQMKNAAFPNGLTLRQQFFIVANGDSKFILTASSLPEQGNKYDAALEAAVKTLTFK